MRAPLSKPGRDWSRDIFSERAVCGGYNAHFRQIVPAQLFRPPVSKHAADTIGAEFPGMPIFCLDPVPYPPGGPGLSVRHARLPGAGRTKRPTIPTGDCHVVDRPALQHWRVGPPRTTYAPAIPFLGMSRRHSIASPRPRLVVVSSTTSRKIAERKLAYPAHRLGHRIGQVEADTEISRAPRKG